MLFSLQITHTHSDRVPAGEEGLLQLAAQGAPIKLVGSVQGIIPVLHELNGAVFKQRIPLTGTLLFYKSKASSASLLPTVIGKKHNLYTLFNCLCCSILFSTFYVDLCFCN